MSACTGLCCAAFSIPFTVEELRERIKPVLEPDGTVAKTALHDAEQIADMVIPLTVSEAFERQVRFGAEDPNLATDAHWHTCRNWDEDTRRCTIYEERPMMRRSYPGRRPCRHGCGYCGGIAYEDPADPEAVLAALKPWRSWVGPLQIFTAGHAPCGRCGREISPLGPRWLPRTPPHGAAYVVCEACVVHRPWWDRLLCWLGAHDWSRMDGMCVGCGERDG